MDSMFISRKDGQTLISEIWSYEDTQYLKNSGDSFDKVSIGIISDLNEEATPDRNDLADINGDGQLDVVVALEKGTYLLWFEQKTQPNESVTLLRQNW